MPVSSLYLNETVADVHFIVPDSKSETKCRFPAHTQVLSAESESFQTMFYGSFGKPDEVEIPDAKSDDFKTFLQYIYCGSVELTDDNVFPVLYLAKKYLVQSLVDMCQERIQRICPTVANVIYLIAQAQRCGGVLQTLWDSLDKTAEDALLADDFRLLDRSLLRAVLQRSTLRIKEATVYKRLKAWGERQVLESGAMAPISDEHIREFLGKDIWLVRFTHMTAAEFASGPAQDGVLTDKEKLDIYGCLIADKLQETVKDRLPLLNTDPRDGGMPKFTIETLVPGDGKNFPSYGATVYTAKGNEHEPLWEMELNGSDLPKGFELALMAMSVGEKARITVARELLCDDDGRLNAEDGELFRTVVYTLVDLD
ncbi:BTB/POZ domain-containing protein 6-A [Aphelenchoides avenae]|nr:BTB/POZ domain-containing protein 6-A [Aphelenchus avenae]